MKQKLLAAGGVAILTLCCVGCAPPTVVPTPQMYYPEHAMQEYLQRSDTVTLSAGNDQEVNSRIQMVDPWPPYVADRRIPTSGERMAGAVARMRDVSKIDSTPKPLGLGSTGGPGGGGSGGK
jgi:hypothetical protein